MEKNVETEVKLLVGKKELKELLELPLVATARPMDLSTVPVTAGRIVIQTYHTITTLHRF